MIPTYQNKLDSYDSNTKYGYGLVLQVGLLQSLALNHGIPGCATSVFAAGGFIGVQVQKKSSIVHGKLKRLKQQVC